MDPFFERLAEVIATPHTHQQRWRARLQDFWAVATHPATPVAHWHQPIAEGPAQGWTAWTWAACMKWRHPHDPRVLEWEIAWKLRTGMALPFEEVNEAPQPKTTRQDLRAIPSSGWLALTRWRHLVKQMNVIRVGGSEPTDVWRFQEPCPPMTAADLAPLLTTATAVMRSPRFTRAERQDVAGLMLTLAFSPTWVAANAPDHPWVPLMSAFAAQPAQTRWSYIEAWLAHAPTVHMGNNANLGWPRQLSSVEVEGWFGHLNDQMLSDVQRGMPLTPSLWKRWNNAVQQNVAHAAYVYLSNNLDCRPAGDTGFFPLLRQALEEGLPVDHESWLTTADQVSPMYSARLLLNLQEAKARAQARSRAEAVLPMGDALRHRPRRLRS